MKSTLASEDATAREERAWFAASAILLAAGVVAAVSVWRQWAVCRPDHNAAACVELKGMVRSLPIQVPEASLRVATSASLGAVALTLAVLAWLVLIGMLPVARPVRVAGVIMAAPLVVFATAAWIGVASPGWWFGLGSTWLILGTVSEFGAAGFLVFAMLASKTPVETGTAQRLILAAAAVTTFGAMHQSAEFVITSFLDPRSTGAPGGFGFGTSLWLVLSAGGLVVLTLLDRRHAAQVRARRLARGGTA